MTPSHYGLLAFILLLDAAPVPRCGARSRTELLVQVRDCSCLSQQLDVLVDDRNAGQLGCGQSLPVEVTPGSHTVWARDSAKAWPQQSVSVRQGETTTVRLACP